VRESRWPWLVFIAVLALYARSSGFEFLNYDDQPYLLDNFRFRGLSLSHLHWMFTSTLGGPYQPLTWLSFAIDFKLWGMQPQAFHWTNIIIHGLAAVVFYLLAREILQRTGATRVSTTAAVAALLFALHPLRVESVVWVIERKDVLSGLLLFAATLCYLRRQVGRSWLLFVLSLLAKGVGVTFPLVLLVLDIYPLNRLGSWRSWGEKKLRPLWVEKALFALPAAGALGIGLYGQRVYSSMDSLASFGWIERLAQCFYGLAYYVRATLWPFGLLPVHERPMPFIALSAPFVLSALAVICFGVWLWVQRRRYPAVVAAAGVYTIVLLPVLGLVGFGGALVADRYSYLACAPWAIIFAVGLNRLGPRVRPLTVIVLVALCLLNWRYAGAWRNSTSLWEYTLRADGQHATAHINLGALAQRAGDFAVARGHYGAALSARPNMRAALSAMADLRMTQRRPAEAEALYRKALRVSPKDGGLHHGLARALEQLGRRDEAQQHYQQAYRRETQFVAPASTVDIEELRRLRRRVAEHPQDVVALFAYGNALAAAGDPRGAEGAFRTIIAQVPTDSDALFNLGNALTLQGRLTEAASVYRQTLKLKPGFAPAQENLRQVETYLKRRKAN
jgi:tetratricopeptide (TPR) repeat protein